MKKTAKWMAPLLAALLLAGCLPTEDSPTTSFSRPGYWDDVILQTSSTHPTNGTGGNFEIPTAPSTQSRPSSVTTKPTTKPTTRPSTAPSTQPPLPPSTNPDVAGSKLYSSRYARYTGLYMEDGKDEYVVGVAALYVTNTSAEYLEYASIQCDISGKEASFIVTGLKPGDSAWVLERNRLVIADADIQDVSMTIESAQTSFLEDNRDDSADVLISLKNGHISAYNNTGENLKSVYVYYKKQLMVNDEYQSGQYLGGITYRVLLGDITNGKTSDAIAGHCTPTGCEVVRITWQ